MAQSNGAGDTGPVGKGRLWAGRVLSALPVLMLLMSAVMKLRHPPEVVQMFTGKFGYPESALLTLGLLELTCTLLYVLPWTSLFGAVLLTGYLGGAVATHVRVGDPFLAPVAVGVLLWLGLYLRDRRLQALLPLRTPALS
jgi:hypothetical protein